MNTEVTEPPHFDQRGYSARLAKRQPTNGVIILAGQWTETRGSGSCRIKVLDNGSKATMSAFSGGKQTIDVVLPHTKDELRLAFLKAGRHEIRDKLSKVDDNIILMGRDRGGLLHEISLHVSPSIRARALIVLT